MNESLLNALMELAALFARVNKTRFVDNAYSLLRTYLDQTVSSNYSRHHFRNFQDHFKSFPESEQELMTDEPTLKQKIGTIVKRINAELNEEERLVLFLSFLELIKLDRKIEPDELSFVEILSFELHISRNDYKNCLIFILCDDSEINQEENSDFLVVTDKKKSTFDELEGSWIEQNKPQEKEKKLHLINNDLNGELLILRLQNINLLAGRYFGNHSLYVNNKRIFPGKFFLLGQFDQLKIGTNGKLTYQDIYTGFKSALPHTGLKFTGENVSTRSSGKVNGFASFNFCEEPGNLVLILCNDTDESRDLSLLLAGQLPGAKGKICLNGYNIYSDRYKVHKMIGLVPTDNIFDENISIYQNFWFSARLSFPGYSDQKVMKLVEQTVLTLGLKDVSQTPVKKIHSGIPSEYLKVLINTGLELIRDPYILILDLPLEKLNSNSAEEFCNILKAEVNNGRLVFITSINPGACVLKRSDRMWIFDSGRYLIYRGLANNALNYFKNAGNSLITEDEICPVCGHISADQLVHIINLKVIDNQGKITHTRKTSPEEWYDIYRKRIEEIEVRSESRKVIPSFASSIPNVHIQFTAYLKKNFLSFISNPLTTVLILIAGLVLGFLIAGLLRYDWTNQFTFSRHEYLPLLFFLNTVICFVTGAVTGLYFTANERLQVAFDHFKNYSFFSYLNVKYLLTALISMIFSLIFTYIIDFVSGINNLFFLNWLIYFSIFFIGGSVGLFFGFISTNLRSALFVTMILLVLDVLFSGYILPYNSLPKQLASEKYVPAFAEVIPGRWAYEALVVQQVKDNTFQKNLFKTEQAISDLTFKTNILIPKLQEELYNIGTHQSQSPNLALFYRELSLINKNYPDIFQFEFLEDLNKNQISSGVLSELEDYVRYVQFQLYEKLKENIALRNTLRQSLKDSLGNEKYEQMLNSSFNPPLVAYVSAGKPGKKFIANAEEIIQTDDPIFRLPDNNFGRSHFFAPQKLMNGYYYDTTYFNLFVLWLEIFVVYIFTLILRKKSIV